MCCESEHALLETISSRCQKINLNSSQNLNVGNLAQRFDNQFVKWLRAAFKANKIKKQLMNCLPFQNQLVKRLGKSKEHFYRTVVKFLEIAYTTEQKAKTAPKIYK